MPEKFTITKRGYETFEVDRYVESIEEVIKSYKEKDAAIKNAILNAQIAADNIVKNAEQQAEAIQREATAKLDGVSRSIDGLKLMMQNFEDEYNAFMQRYIADFDKSGAVRLRDSLGKLEDYVTKLKASEK